MKLYITMDVEWCDNILHCTPRKDARELQLMRLGLSNFLELANAINIKGAIFVTGETAPLVADLLSDAIALGFDIGSHSMHHNAIGDMSTHEFERDLNASLIAINNACGVRPRGYRAPSFSLPPTVEYLQVLQNAGIEFDSSLAVGRHASGWSISENQFSRIATTISAPKLVPVRSIGSSGNIFPGGGYFRLATGNAFHKMLSETQPRSFQVLYFHPRDFVSLYIPRNTLHPLKFIKSCISIGKPSQKFMEVSRGKTFLCTKKMLSLI